MAKKKKEPTTLEEYTKANKPKEIRVTLERDISSSLNGSLDSAIEVLKNLKKKHKGAKDVCLKSERHRVPYENYEEFVVEVTCLREENKEEWHARLDKEWTQLQNQTGWKRKQYEALKKEFGD